MKNNYSSTTKKNQKARRRRMSKVADFIQSIAKVVLVILAIILVIWLFSKLVDGLNPKNKTGDVNQPTQSTTAPTDNYVAPPLDAPSETSQPTTESTTPTTEPTEVTQPTTQSPTETTEPDVVIPRYLTKDLNYIYTELSEEPANYPVAWVMPKMTRFIRDDLEEARRADADLAYSFKANLLFVNYNETTGAYSATFQFDGKVDTGEELMNCSIYKTADGKVVVYGYTNGGKQFEKVVLDGANSTREVLIYDVNFPFFMKTESEKAIRIPGGYSLCVMANEFFAIYKDGQEVTIVRFEGGATIKEYDLAHGYFITKTGQVYSINLTKSLTGEPMVDIYCAGGIKENGKFSYYLVEITENSKKIELPVFVNEAGKELVLAPYSWEEFYQQAPGYATEIVSAFSNAKSHLIDLSQAQTVEHGNGPEVYSFYDRLFTRK